METVVANAANVGLKQNLVNGEQQLRRLRELILRLELHNKRRSPTRARGHRACTPPSCQLGSPGPPEHRVQYLQQQDQYEPLVLDEVELLDLELIGFSDHETWLYVPPKTNKKNCENYLTPLQWCRHILEAPEWKLAKHDMRLQLEIASCWRKLLYSPRPTSTPPAVSRVAVVSPIGTSRTTCSSPQSPEMHASSRPHSQNPSGRARTPTFIPHPTRGSSQRRRSLLPQVDRDVIVDEDDLVPHGYKLQDLTDVQVIARLQEEIVWHAIPHYLLPQNSGGIMPALQPPRPTGAARATPSRSAPAPAQRRKTRRPARTAARRRAASAQCCATTPSPAPKTGKAAASCLYIPPPHLTPLQADCKCLSDQEQKRCSAACPTFPELTVFPSLIYFVLARALILQAARLSCNPPSRAWGAYLHLHSNHERPPPISALASKMR
ncbi:SLAIN motif-containing protein-like isoform X4 [Hippocampus comes]|uniref:SLAIN motif-containing protein-like isoform X4 n=1 Tax=Hippocampus comes TaxID=109280 RepID=UPI00094E3F62|nr:PREDICTED: SLAIN motif-containing protein-like isoform X4 [Hippocampus comes]